ncbi:MAG: CapA family protein [Treponema sp.]|nr:CapA family protein [Treponema sp.]
MKRVWLLFFILILVSCGLSKPAVLHDGPAGTIPEGERRYTATLLAAGDNLFHDTIIASSKITDRSSGKIVYDFLPIYSQIESLIKKADIAFINQETVMGGERFGFSGYPRFNTPSELASVLADTGFNVISHANNHAMDMGEAGLAATLDLWDTIQGVTVIGAQQADIRHRIIVKNNISIGFLSYTYGLNGMALPTARPWLVSLINRGKIAEDIAVLRPLCDFLVVSMHWGEEYRSEPDQYQRGLAAFLAEQNVDLIIGHHPHVLQRFESLGRPDGKTTLCFYSLGNFVSHQRRKERILGALLHVTFVKEGDELSIIGPTLVPVICHFDRNLSNTRVYPLYSYSEELLKNHWCAISDNALNFGFIHSVLNKLQVNILTQDPFP